ncbi:MAG TPA: ComEC/Rec2 family competence protein [Methylomirabilota bacterium]|nr:ComEC/Rec2 family competence protein [Methylomirabilota bacterium]
MNLKRTPLAPAAAAFGVGIAASSLAAPAVFLAAWLIAVAACLVLLAVSRTAAAAVALLLGVVAVGGLRGGEMPLPPDHVKNLGLPRILRVEGRLADEPRRFTQDRARLLIDTERVEDARGSGLIQVTAYGILPSLTEGQRVAAPLRLHAASGFRNPGTYDYAAHLAREGIHVVATTRAESVEPLDAPPSPWSVRVKRESVAAIGRALPPASAALLAGLLLGDRTELPRDIDDAFRRAGVYHVLAVSGFNVGILAASVWALCRLLRVPHRPSAVVAIVVVIAFALVVGPEPSVLRAVVMAVLVLLASLLDRDASVTNSLALAALAILAVRPGDLFDPGFQLSFAATLGIVIAPVPRGVVAGAVGVSAAAQAAVLPIALTHFNQLSTIGIVANLGVVPLAGVATVVGLVAVGLSFVSEIVAAVAFDALWPVLLALRGVVLLAAQVPGAVVHLPAPGWLAITCYAAGLAALLVWHQRAGKPRRALLLLGIALVALAVGCAAWPLVRPADGLLRLTILDVGQGDAIVIEMPDGRAILVDAGSGGPMRLDAGERVVAPFLWNRGILRLAGIAVTHDDSDHAGGVTAIRRLFAIDEEWAAAAPMAPHRFGRAVIAPLAASAVPGGRRNDGALVLRVDMGLASFLLTSDIGAVRERELVGAGARLESTVLKVAHHGSRSSTGPDLLRAVGPRLAAISVGARNAYGHPDPAVLGRLAAGGTQIYRTDRDGALIFETDGGALTVTRWAAQRVDRFCLDPEAIC